MTKKSLTACAAVSLIALAGCASSPSTCPPTAGPVIQAPAAWAMTPSRSMQTFNAVFSTSEKPSQKTSEK